VTIVLSDFKKGNHLYSRQVSHGTGEMDFAKRFTSCGIESLGYISTTLFPTIPLEVGGLILDDQKLGKKTKHIFI